MKKLTLKEVFESSQPLDIINQIQASFNHENHDEGRNFDYGQVKSDSNEGKMAKETCKSIMRNAKELENFLRNEDDIPEWCHSHLAVCEDRIQTVLNYLKSKG